MLNYKHTGYSNMLAKGVLGLVRSWPQKRPIPLFQKFSDFSPLDF